MPPDSGEENRVPFLAWPQSRAPVGPGPKSAPSLGSTAAACRFYREKRSPLTCERRDRNSSPGVRPTPFYFELQSAMAAEVPAPRSSFRAGGCFPPDGPQGHSSTSRKFRLLAVPPPIPRPSAPAGWSQPSRNLGSRPPERSSGPRGPRQRRKRGSVAWENYP